MPKKTVGKYELGKVLGRVLKSTVGNGCRNGKRSSCKSFVQSEAAATKHGLSNKEENLDLSSFNHPNVVNLVEVLASGRKFLLCWSWSLAENCSTKL